MTVLINEIDVEIWDREDDEEKPIEMTISIYNGASDSSTWENLTITPEEAIQITGKSQKELLGFTEWHTASGLLFMDLPERVDKWAIDKIAEYTGIDSDRIRMLRVASIAMAGQE